MKKSFSIIFLLVFLISFAQEGISFETTSFKEVLAKAKKEKKLVFLDAFASWCGPCKNMERNIFPLERVKAYYNANFINARFDMEKGEGRDIAAKYGIRSYPTYLFLNGDGEVVNKSYGYMEEGAFLELAKASNNPSGKTMQQRFDEGESDTDFLMSIIRSNANTDFAFAKKAADRYFMVKKDKNVTPDEAQILMYFVKSEEDVAYPFFRDNKLEITKYIPESDYNKLNADIKIAKIATKSVNEKSNTIDRNYFLSEATKLISAEDAQKMLNSIEMNYYYQQNKFDLFAQAASQYYGDGSNAKPDELAAMAFVFSEKISDLKLLNQAKTWAEKNYMSSETSDNAYILAKLYQKTGKLAEAKMFAEQAVAVGKRAGSSTELAEKLLNELR